jgi:hypothetical protein
MPHELSQNGRDAPLNLCALLKRAEGRIQSILIEVEEETGKRVDHVDVDTRNFANLRTEIHLQ